MIKSLCPRQFALCLLTVCICMFSYVIQTPRGEAQEISYYYMPQDAPIFWSGPTSKQAVALTFDDGPDPMYTPQVLNILAKYNVKATFFLVGNQTERNLALAEMILAKGHEIGCHTMTHPEANKSTSEQLQKEVLDSVTLLQGISKQKIKFLRPPYGQISPSYFSACQAQGIKMILWSIDSNDWKLPPVDQMLQQVASQVHPGSIILFHDGGGVRQNTVEALDKLLPLLQQMKLEPMSLSQLLDF